jgi:hypothetical protein
MEPVATLPEIGCSVGAMFHDITFNEKLRFSQ